MATVHEKSHYRKYPKVDFSLAQVEDPTVITYKLFRQQDDSESYTLLGKSDIVPELLGNKFKTVVLIHGWTSSDAAQWYRPMKDAYLSASDCNVIYVDWSAYAHMRYHVSCANVKLVAEFIAEFLGKLELPAESLHLIGHSLGAQLAGFVGKSYQRLYDRKIGRITGLDPAGPQWGHEHMGKDERLSELDADFVDVVHTDIQVYGYTHPCGHVDFYPNGGTNQPGCPQPDSNANCNHHRAPRYFIESIHSKILAKEMELIEDEAHDIVIKQCDRPETVVFGEHVPRSSRGVFYFRTSHAEPYLDVLD